MAQKILVSPVVSYFLLSKVETFHRLFNTNPLCVCGY